VICNCSCFSGVIDGITKVYIQRLTARQVTRRGKADSRSSFAFFAASSVTYPGENTDPGWMLAGTEAPESPLHSSISLRFAAGFFYTER